MNTEPSGSRLAHPGILALCLASLCIALICGMGLLHARHEVSLLTTELQLSATELREVRQQLEAERLISRRQIEMLREQQNPASKPSP